MPKLRSIVAGLVALAVAFAPVAAMLIAGVRVHAPSVAAAHDCHGKTMQYAHLAGDEGHNMVIADQGQHLGLTDADRDSCSGCAGPHHAKCIGDSGKCCKLIGMVAILPGVSGVAEPADLATEPPVLSGWQARPPPPPPRA